MNLILRKARIHDLIMGSDASRSREEDYVILDDTVVVGRIYRDIIHGERWRWFLQVVPATPPNQGTAHTLDGAKTAFKKTLWDGGKLRLHRDRQFAPGDACEETETRRFALTDDGRAALRALLPDL